MSIDKLVELLLLQRRVKRTYLQFQAKFELRAILTFSILSEFAETYCAAKAVDVTSLPAQANCK